MRIDEASFKSSTGVWQRRAIIFLCACAVALPLAIRGSSCGHDFDFHLQSWLAAAQQWRNGVLDSHWAEGANYAAGEPRFVFYPPVSWLLGALLGTVLGWTAAPVAFTLVVMAACGLSMYKLACEWLPANAASVAACAYILNPYALFVAYERTAYGELTACIWLPLIVLYALRETLPSRPPFSLSSGPERAARSRDLSGPSLQQTRHPERSALREPEARRLGAQSKEPPFASRATEPGAPGPVGKLFSVLTWAQPTANTIPLALSITAVWLTNAPAAVMSCYLLAAIAVWRALAQKSLQPIFHSAISLILGLGLAAFYLVPAAYERRWVDIARAIGPGMRVQDSFLFEHTGQSFHDQVLKTASWIFVTMLVTISVFAWVSRKSPLFKRIFTPLFVTASVLVALQLPWSQPIWTYIPELKFLQFPWRWSLVLSMALAIAAGAAAIPRSTVTSTRRLRLQTALTILSALAIVTTATRLFHQPCDEEDRISAQLVLFHADTGFEGTDEYTPLNADNSLIPQNLPPVRLLRSYNSETANPATNTNANANDDDTETPTYAPEPAQEVPATIAIQRWKPEQKVFTITTKTAGYAVLRLMDYPAWRVRTDGTLSSNRPVRDDGLITVPIHSGTTLIELVYAVTPDLWWGRGITSASLLALCFAWFLYSKDPNRRSQAPGSQQLNRSIK